MDGARSNHFDWVTPPRPKMINTACFLLYVNSSLKLLTPAFP